MSMNIHLHPCDRHYPKDMYISTINFELNSWSMCLKTIIENSKPIDKSIQIQWHSRDNKIRSLEEIDSTCTWLINAEVITQLVLYDNTWHQDIIATHKAIYAYFFELPSDWPVIVHYI